jgi:DNA (cytosine-5)-methyltransferase 1
MSKSKFTFIDLFSGIGGFKLALSANGGVCLGFSEIDRDAINAYCENYNFNPDANFGDITQIEELPQHDVLTAGVPCQSWSIAGKNLGFDDDRGQLWNDTIFLLNKSKPKAFIFENVKGLVDPRNRKALNYILDRIKEAGYYADFYVINSHDYGVAQSRVRVYIVGFLEKNYLDRFSLPKQIEKRATLADILGIELQDKKTQPMQRDLFGNAIYERKISLSCTNGFNDYFLFNDLRNGHTTIHSWDIAKSTQRQKNICLLLLKNRRKSQFGPLDGNPLSLKQFQLLDSTITEKELNELVDLSILKKINYRFKVLDFEKSDLSENEIAVLNLSHRDHLVLDDLKNEKPLKVKKISVLDTLNSLLEKGAIECTEERFDFKNTKISSGIDGVNRIFMPTSDVFSTLVASDTNDYISLKSLKPTDHENYKKQFLREVYFPKLYRKITKEEACLIQGFPKEFKLPALRAKWMKLIGNSVSVPVIDILIKSIVSTGIFEHQNNCSTGHLER